MAVLIPGFFLVLLAAWLLWQAGRLRRQSGLPQGRVIYADTGRWGRVERPLYDAPLGLTGKPDYLVEQGASLIPVEVKSASAPPAPHPGHVYQLAAYCLLVERCLGSRPPYGILQYNNRTFAIDYTQQLEAELLDLLANMRREEKMGAQPRSHDEAGRCARCGFRELCDQRLNLS